MESRRLTRRGVLAGGLGLAVAGGALAAAGRGRSWAIPTTRSASAAAARYPFHGDHQAGIVTPAQDRLHFAAFDVSPSRATSWSSCCRPGPWPPSG